MWWFRRPLSVRAFYLWSLLCVSMIRSIEMPMEGNFWCTLFRAVQLHVEPDLMTISSRLFVVIILSIQLLFSQLFFFFAFVVCLCTLKIAIVSAIVLCEWVRAIRVTINWKLFIHKTKVYTRNLKSIYVGYGYFIVKKSFFFLFSFISSAWIKFLIAQKEERKEKSASDPKLISYWKKMRFFFSSPCVCGRK